MSAAKTRPTEVDPRDFLAAIEHPARRDDAHALLSMMQEASGRPAMMWGTSIVGFGSYHYRYPSGREGDTPAIGCSPRASSLALYGLTDPPAAAGLPAGLGKHRLGASCLYVNKLADVGLGILRELMDTGHHHVMTELHQP
ncbi:MAG: DUF1801 domain-containing protein [Arthrobacter sp.]|uniref:DUF1801 domain-containing protein n=1 Tax=unclassified Arthrobacter TaxID=235627 RepID=UPI0026502C1F|nr:DUF1801 domain-containing protein [Micrococcaceae bacterium]MDN5823895.1 DUF1801 domain-containing protein [Micrococcaceae bacterium]MDN5880559.1 DUF1801 domain-containing protein [Micrococcaceae bacterium]MDN5887448.1 DUF1801 domain-containing protein [Micrococcaceae bacterium]MDN5906097.1 DUF1801 domain-containing protein [Micrococcaceae bacterium]